MRIGIWLPGPEMRRSSVLKIGSLTASLATRNRYWLRAWSGVSCQNSGALAFFTRPMTNSICGSSAMHSLSLSRNSSHHGGRGAAHGHVTDVVGRLRVVRRSAASRPGWLRQRRVGGAGGKERTEKEPSRVETCHRRSFRHRACFSLPHVFPCFWFSSASSASSVLSVWFLPDYLGSI